MKEYPSAIEHEKKLLSALMLNGGAAVPEVTEKLSAEDFYRPDHRQIYRAIVAASANAPLDVLLVGDELRRMKANVDPVYLMSLVDLEFTTARVQIYADIIKEKSRLRRLIELSEVAIDKASREEATATELRDELENALMQVDETAETWRKAGNVATAAFERAEALSKSGELTGVTTGLIDLNRVTNGLQSSDLIYLAARPSMGKTALALNMAHNAARGHKVTAIFSLEMGAMQLGMRLLSMTGNVEAEKIRSGNLNDDDRVKLVSALNHIDGLPLYIDETSGLTIPALDHRLYSAYAGRTFEVGAKPRAGNQRNIPQSESVGERLQHPRVGAQSVEPRGRIASR